MNPSKAKGTAFEVSLLPALREIDPRTERSALKGSLDAGDFTVLNVRAQLRIVVSAKNCKQLSLSGWLKEAEKQRLNARAAVAVVIHKKRGTTNPEEQYVTMNLGTLIRLLA